MKKKTLLPYSYLYFSRWSKKRYAVFAALGREVKIARLAIHMYKNVLLKAMRQGVIVNRDGESVQDFLSFLFEKVGMVCESKRGEFFLGMKV